MITCDTCGKDTHKSSLVYRSIELPFNPYVVMLYNEDVAICTVCDEMTDQELEEEILLAEYFHREDS